MDVFPEANANSAGGYAVDLNAKFRCRLFVYGSLQKFVSVLDRVRMRERSDSASQTFRLFAFRQRLRIIQSPRTNGTSLQNELHRLFGAEFDAGLLDFAIRQKPDERFIVEIDNLDAVAPRIMKIAAKRRLQF